jgi:hypothetical protein
MPELSFEVTGVRALEPAAVPTLGFGILVRSADRVPVRSAALNIQLRIAAARRGYDREARERLVELFGLPEQWGRSLRSLHWTNVTANVGPFSAETAIEVPVTCTYDLEVTAARYFEALDDGEVPLELLFGGSVFYADEGGALQVEPIAWDREAEWRLPLAVWREAIDRHFPGSGWLRLGRDSLERLHAYRAQRALLSWEETVDSLLAAAGETREVVRA